MTIADLKLDSHDSHTLAKCINEFGTGQHPEANELSIDYFMVPYAMRCVDAALARCADVTLLGADPMQPLTQRLLALREKLARANQPARA